MCAPVSATVGGSVTAMSFATTMLINQILAIVGILTVVGYKVVKTVKSL